MLLQYHLFCFFWIKAFVLFCPVLTHLERVHQIQNIYNLFIYGIQLFMRRITKSIVFKNLYQISKDKYEKFPVESYEVGQRLDRYLKSTPIGWVNCQKCLRKKQILVQKNDGSTTNENVYRFEEGDSLLYAPYLRKKYYSQKPESIKELQFQKSKDCLERMLIFDNKNITILNKQNGYSVQGDQEVQNNLFSLMASRYKKQFVHITHRLDKVTTGIVLFAKNRQTAQLIQKGMEEKFTFNKYYLAMTEGPSIPQQDYIRCNIEWTNKQKARLCSQTQSGSKDCVTFYKVFEQKQNKKLLGVKLLTGRKHQIRCHFGSYLDNPILNDGKYGGKNINGKDAGIFLHAFGMKIRSQEIVQKIFSSQNRVENKENGFIKISKNEVKVIGKTNEKWKDIVRNKDLQKMMMGIQESEIEMRKFKPKKKNISQIV